jgi:hypothetical protein
LSPLPIRLREFMRLTIARVECLPRWGSPQWHSLWSYIVVEGALTAYLVAVLLVALRLVGGDINLVNSSWAICCVIAIAMLAAWSTCRGLDKEEKSEALRDRLARHAGVDRFREVSLGLGFLIGGLLSLSGASYFVTR